MRFSHTMLRRANASRAVKGLLATALIALSWSGTAVAQTFTEFPVPTASSGPRGITTGPDGALWFTEHDAGKIGRITTAGVVTNEFAIPVANVSPYGITTGPDGALWFVDSDMGNTFGSITTAGSITTHNIAADPNDIATGSDGALWFTEGTLGKIGRSTTSGGATGFVIPTALSQPDGITAGSDGALWFAENTGNKIGRITTAGVVTNEYAIPSGGSPFKITAGPDGAVWFTENPGNKIGRITTAGAITEFTIPTASSGVKGITAGPDGALWFAEANGNKIGRITTAGSITEFPVPTAGSAPFGITAGPDGALWFAEQNANKIGRFAPAASTSLLLSAVLPSSRSVQVGATATAFATLINAGTSAATSCGPTPVTGVPASFVYQTTNPATNALAGSANTPASISAGASQSFVVAFTANAPFVPTNLNIGFACANAAAASSSPGLNTLLLSASATPVPDIVALGATTSNDGILHITGTAGSAAFAVATVDLGATSAITVTANTGSVTLPLTITVCETVPSSGACMAAPTSSVTTTINANATPTFAFFGTASGAIPFSPAVNRVFVQFSDTGGAVRGSTSVAVETQ